MAEVARAGVSHIIDMQIEFDDTALAEPCGIEVLWNPVDDDFQPSGDIGVQTVAGGEYAIATHTGPYNQLGNTYTEFLGQWLPRSGRELRNAPCFEVYVNDPQGTPADELMTDIYVPLQEQLAAVRG